MLSLVSFFSFLALSTIVSHNSFRVACVLFKIDVCIKVIYLFVHKVTR